MSYNRKALEKTVERFFMNTDISFSDSVFTLSANSPPCWQMLFYVHLAVEKLSEKVT